MTALLALGAFLGHNASMPVQGPTLLSNETSEVRPLIDRFVADRDLMRRSIPVALSPKGRQEMRAFLADWLDRVQAVPFDKLSVDGCADAVLLANHLSAQIRRMDLDAPDYQAAERLIEFSGTVWGLRESLRQMEPIDAEGAASTLATLETQINTLKQGLAKDSPKVSLSVAKKAFAILQAQREELKEWFDFYNTYDPNVTWWCAEPYKRVDLALDQLGKAWKEHVLPPEDEERVPPIGAEALQAELRAEMIPYSPQDLVKIAEREYAWCEAEMKKAARELGYQDDWRKALEHVKTLHVPPGEQPQMIKELALEAIDFVERSGTLTIPELAKNSWRMTMMSPDRQRTSPFFLGGEVIMVSFPTSTMTHEEKRMSMRGNNRHFARATVHHELIPGHHLQGFMTQRHRPYRRLFDTPFWVEGWALYWEFLLWNMDFPKTPENKIGMLFWRMHRCIRIVFSLRYHLGTLKPAECVDMLVERVGHERANAEAEVRRSFNGSYPPLYQAAYMLGALQIWRLREELVDTGKMKERAFHDALLKEGPIPIEVLRAILTKTKLPRDFSTSWRFYPALESPDKPSKKRVK